MPLSCFLFCPLGKKKTEDLRSGSDMILRSGTLSSFVFCFCARRAQKQNTDTTGSTMLPYILSLSKGRLKRRL
jgi:hypothetical protein